MGKRRTHLRIEMPPRLLYHQSMKIAIDSEQSVGSRRSHRSDPEKFHSRLKIIEAHKLFGQLTFKTKTS